MRAKHTSCRTSFRSPHEPPPLPLPVPPMPGPDWALGTGLGPPSRRLLLWRQRAPAPPPLWAQRRALPASPPVGQQCSTRHEGAGGGLEAQGQG